MPPDRPPTLTHKDIAAELGISINTVANLAVNAYEKAGTHSAAAAALPAAIVVRHTSRFARNALVSRKYKDELRQRGVKVIAINAPFDTARPEGKFAERMMEAVDEFTSDTIGWWLESWHMVEHIVIISNVLAHGGCPCPGIVDAATGISDTVLHFFYNALTYIAIVACFIGLVGSDRSLRRKPVTTMV